MRSIWHDEEVLADEALWRYFRADRFVSALQSSLLHFPSAHQFDDPFEGAVAVLRNNFPIDPRYPEPDILDAAFAELRRLTKINYWHCADYESAAMWTLYAANRKGVAIRTTAACLQAAEERFQTRAGVKGIAARLPHRRYSCVMGPLRYSVNVTLDGCCDHREMFADEDLHRHVVENLVQADALLFGRVTYEMMEAAWRPPARTGAMPDWMEPFARTIDAAKKYVVSNTLDRVDWNSKLVRGDLGKAVQQPKRELGKGLFVGGVTLPLALAELGLIDEYEFVVQPRLAGHGPTLFAGLSKRVDLKLVSRLEFGSGAVAMRYEPNR